MKQKFETIYFEFTSPLHISNIKADYSLSEKSIHSDTLYAAIMHSWAVLGKSEWINDQPKFTLSSLFPYTTLGTSKVHFFPKPYLKANYRNLEVPSEDAKKFKKIKYVDAIFFENLLNNTEQAYDISTLKSIFQTAEKIDSDFITTGVQQRVMKPRNEHDDPELHEIDRIFFKKNSGFFCIVQYETLEAENKIKAALNLLSENGIGTDKSVGNGQFNLSFGNLELDLPENTNYCTNISLYCPETKEELEVMLEDENVKYELVKRGGWISEPYNTLRKRSTLMFLEGSIFRMNSKSFSIKGKTVNLKPLDQNLKIDNPIFRVGKSFFLPVKI